MKGLSRLKETYEVRTCWHPNGERGYLSAPDPDRGRALQNAIRDPQISAIICVRGGYGCLRLLPHLDWDLARRHPTLLVGYSDVTALHLAFYAHAQWPGISGPVVTEWAKADGATLNSFRAFSRGRCPSLVKDFDQSLEPIVSGTASGRLLGGNLSVLTRLIGTEHLPDFEEAILVLEEVSEEPYRVDRMLAHLQVAGVLESLAGVVLGEFTTGDLPENKPTLSLAEVFHDYFTHRTYPVVRGLPYGHRLPRCSLPIGAPVRLTARSDHASLDVLSSVVEM